MLNMWSENESPNATWSTSKLARRVFVARTIFKPGSIGSTFRRPMACYMHLDVICKSEGREGVDAARPLWCDGVGAGETRGGCAEGAPKRHVPQELLVHR